MGLKILSKIRKIEEILPNFCKLFEKIELFVKKGTIIFHIFFRTTSESSVKNFGRQKTRKDIGRCKFRKISSEKHKLGHIVL